MSNGEVHFDVCEDVRVLAIGAMRNLGQLTVAETAVLWPPMPVLTASAAASPGMDCCACSSAACVRNMPLPGRLHAHRMYHKARYKAMCQAGSKLTPTPVVGPMMGQRLHCRLRGAPCLGLRCGPRLWHGRPRLVHLLGPSDRPTFLMEVLPSACLNTSASLPYIFRTP